ncbi:MAG: substrate-binding domain-containing protein [Oscillospiraceae bacterium]|nr:substrate-binding domain-containing protein [Oscillospiraceae bacterium]
MAWSKTVTIREIADAAGVSTATVSRVLNRNGNVRDETEKEVRKAMAELRFIAKDSNAAGEMLPRYILAAFPNMSNPFNADLMRGMQETAIHRGYEMLYYRPERPLDALPVYLDMLRTAYVAGIILVHSLRNIEELEQACAKHPLVTCSEYYASEKIPSVSIDNYAAAKTVMSYLFATGRRRIGLINSALQRNQEVFREKAYREQMALHGADIQPDWVVHLPEVNFDLAVSTATTMLQADNRPEAIFCVSDIYAAATIKAASTLGIPIPSQLAVVGFDDIDLASIFIPDITTIAQPTFQLGAQACNLLLDRIANPEEAVRHIVLGVKLVVRASSL